MWSTRTELSMLRRCQQVGEHSDTGTCVLLSFVFPLFCVFSIILSLCWFNIWLVIFFFFSAKTNLILFPHLSSTYAYSEEQHQHLVFSPCFSERAALILLDKGWESQENISACAHVHICRHAEIKAVPLSADTGAAQQNTHHSENM